MLVRFYHKIQKVSLVGLCYLSMPVSAFAGTSQVDSVLKAISGLITGTWGKAFCTLAIAGVGYACFVLGKLPISRAIAVAIGAACVMGAGELLTEIGVSTQG